MTSTFFFLSNVAFGIQLVPTLSPRSSLSFSLSMLTMYINCSFTTYKFILSIYIIITKVICINLKE